MEKELNMDNTILHLLSSSGIFRIHKGYPYVVAGIRILLNPQKYNVTNIDQLYEKLCFTTKPTKTRMRQIKTLMKYTVNMASKAPNYFLVQMLDENQYSLNGLNVWTFLVSATEWILWHNAIYIKSDPHANWNIVWRRRRVKRKQSTIPSSINIDKY